MVYYRNTVGVVVLLENAVGQIAMQLRDDKPNLPGANSWGLFGGLIEPDETPHEAALREIQEELSVTLTSEKLETIGDCLLPNNVRCYVFRYPVQSELDGAVLQEGQTWRFVERNELASLTIADVYLQLLRRYWL